MNEDTTKNLPAKVSFEERVFARFDAIDVRLEKLESRSYDTKPIWERALAAIMKTGLEVGEIKTRVAVIETAVAGLATDVGILKTDVGVLKTDVGVLKTDVGVLKTDVGVLKTDVGGLKTDVRGLKSDVVDLKTNYGSLRNEFVDIRRELRENVRQELTLILKFLIEDRQDIRDAEDRIRQVEAKLA